MATSNISNTITPAPAAGTVIVATLKPYGGFRISSGTEIGQVVTTTTNGSGFWTMALERQANITPTGTFWQVEERIAEDDGGARVWAISVGNSDVTLYASLIDPITSTAFSAYLTQAVADARYATIGTGATLVINPISSPYNAVGDGVANDTAAVQAALDALPTSSGAQLWLPQGKNFLCGGLTLNGKSNVTITGPGKITWTGTGSAPSGYIGLKLSGTCVNVEIVGVHFVGDGNAAHFHAGIWTDAGANLTDVRLVNNYITATTVGIQIGSSTGSIDVGTLIQGNYIDAIVGTASGTGYGIAKSGGPTSLHMRIIANQVIGCQRHGIYVSNGSSVTVTGNIVRNNRAVGGVTSNAGRIEAIVVARAQNTNVTGNVVENAQDGGLDIEPDVSAGQNVLGINVSGNNFYNCLPYAMWLGTDTPAAVGMQDNQALNVVGNTIVDNGNNTTGIRISTGTRIKVSNNMIFLLNETSTVYCIYVQCVGETAGTATYSNQFVVENNLLSGSASGGGHVFGIDLASTASQSAVVMRFVNNSYYGPDTTFSYQGSPTNPNIIIAGQGSDGYVPGANYLPYPIPSPIELVEQNSDVSAPATNNARVYARDSGAGKTQLVVRFPTGAIQVLATEP